MFDFASRFVKDVESNLAKVLSTKKVDVFGIEAENILEEGYAYATADGGKRIRPVCVYLGAIATGKDLSGKYDGLVNIATMVELSLQITLKMIKFARFLNIHKLSIS